MGMVPNSQVKLRVARKKHCVSFIASVNAPETDRVGDLTAFGAEGSMLLPSARALRAYPAGMETGKVWHDRLNPGEREPRQRAGT